MLLTLIAIVWVLIWVVAVVDLVRRPDLGRTAKVAWGIIVLVLPVIGLIGYLIARPPAATDFDVPEPAVSADEQLRARHPF